MCRTQYDRLPQQYLGFLSILVPNKYKKTIKKSVDRTGCRERHRSSWRAVVRWLSVHPRGSSQLAGDVHRRRRDPSAGPGTASPRSWRSGWRAAGGALGAERGSTVHSRSVAVDVADSVDHSWESREVIQCRLVAGVLVVAVDRVPAVYPPTRRRRCLLQRNTDTNPCNHPVPTSIPCCLTVLLFRCNWSTVVIVLFLCFTVGYVTLLSAPGQHCRAALYKFIL